MANTTFEERRLLRVEAAERAGTRAKGHRLDAARWEKRGQPDKAAKSTELAERYEATERGHRAEADRLEGRQKANAYRMEDGAKAKAAMEARAAAQRVERAAPDPLEAFIEATQQAQRHEEEIQNLRARRDGLLRVGADDKATAILAKIDKRIGWADQWRKEGLALIASSGRDLASEWAARTTLEAEERRARVELKLPLDLRTAGAQREFVAGSSRHAKIASLAEYASLIPRPHARTPVRLDAMARFDKLCSWSEEGLFPTVDLLKGGGGSGGDSYHTGYAQGLRALDALRKAIGGRNVEMLRRRIYERQTLTQLAREGFGAEKTAGVLILAAIDAMAVHFAGKADGAAESAGRRSVAASTRLAP